MKAFQWMIYWQLSDDSVKQVPTNNMPLKHIDNDINERWAMRPARSVYAVRMYSAVAASI